MPNNKQAKKRLRQDEQRRVDNKIVTSRMRTAVRRVREAETAEEAKARLPEAMKRVDKAAKKGVLHSNAAARKKHQLSRAVESKG
jgi:small subunit ribosomal protein S20